MTTIGGLGANLIAALTPVARSMLSDSCLVKRPTHTADGAMGYTDALSAGTTYICLIQVQSKIQGGKETVAASRVTVEERYRISFMAGTDIKPQDQVTQVSSGLKYIVTNNIDNETASPLLTVDAAYASK
jgi:hypothetical protein